MSYLVRLLSHPAGPWQQPSLISSILAHSAVQPFSNPPHWAGLLLVVILFLPVLTGGLIF